MFTLYDPLFPHSYYQSCFEATGNRYGFALAGSIFCPRITTVSEARLYGISYVLEPAGGAGPPGSLFDTKVGTEGLYRIPGAAAATITPMSASGPFPPVDASGTPVSVSHPNPAAWRMTTDATTPQVLRIRLTNVPGWHATIDGKPLSLERYEDVMIQARIPAGNHVVELRYWPDAFTLGIVLALLSIVVLVAAIIVEKKRRDLFEGGALRREAV